LAEADTVPEEVGDVIAAAIAEDVTAAAATTTEALSVDPLL